MFDDTFVSPRSTQEIADAAIAWREALGVRDAWAPCMVRAIENKLTEIFPEFALLVKRDTEMGDAEAYTQFSPPRIMVRESVYKGALGGRGRDRMTLAHELGHLVMHARDRRLHRLADGNKKAPTAKKYESAEWQASKFASLFLMPNYIVKDCMSPYEIVERCHVSVKAAEIRFEETKSLRPHADLPDSIRGLQEHFARGG